jgi:hypothetical protein
MDSKDRNPTANVPAQTDEDPRGDRGRGDKTWTPPADEQGISNRPGDESESIEGSATQQRSRSRDEVNKPEKVERGGEVQPDKKDKGSDANIQRDKYGIPEGASPKAVPSGKKA